MSGFTRKRGEQIHEDIERVTEQLRSRRIDEAIARGYQHLWDAEPAALAEVMRDILIPDMGVTRHSLRGHASAVRDHGGLMWSYEDVRAFVEDPDRHIRAVQTDRDTVSALKLRANGIQNRESRAHETITNAFRSVESIAVARGYVSDSVSNYAPAFGYKLQLGTWYQPPRGDMPHEIELVDTGDSEEVTVNMGKPGRGKGVMGHTEAEDRYAAGRKIIDVVDMDECEGAVYDIPQMNDTLRQAREDMGLAPDFTEVDGYAPEVEIMVPLTEHLKDSYIPFYGDGPEDTVVTPFTVPASSLSKTTLKQFVGANFSDTQREVFENAYEVVDREQDDWSLKDLILATEQFRGDHGNQGVIEYVQRALQRVHSRGWIRDKSDDYAINWERILTTPEVITVFTASKMNPKYKGQKYLMTSYVIDALRVELKALKEVPRHEIEHREWDRIPKLMCLFRELHKIAPNNETAEDDDTIRAIQNAMASDFRDLTAMHRHEGVEVDADTQNFIGEIKRRARRNFNRAALFSTDMGPAKRMFQEMAGENRDQYPRRVTKDFGVGECAVLGRVGTERSFEMTVKIAPPMSHHFDPDEYIHTETLETRGDEEMTEGAKNSDKWLDVKSGWDLRTIILGEEMRPARELITEDTSTPDMTEDMERARLDGREPDHTVGKFAWDCLEIDGDRRVIIDNLMEAFTNYTDAKNLHGGWTRPKMCQILRSQQTPEDNDRTFDDILNKRRPRIPEHEDGRKQTPAYYGITFTEDGESFLESDDEPEPEPASEDVDCGCSNPEPEPMMSEQGEELGFKCVACGGKEWF